MTERGGVALGPSPLPALSGHGATRGGGPGRAGAAGGVLLPLGSGTGLPPLHSGCKCDV